MKQKVDITGMITKTEFLNKIKKDFHEIEKTRKSLLFKMRLKYIETILYLCLCIFGMVIAIRICNTESIIIYHILTIIWGLLGIAALVLFLLLPHISSDYYEQYKSKLKDYLINNNMLKKFGIERLSKLEYDYNAIIKKSNLFPDFADANFDDIIGNSDFIAMETDLIHTDSYPGQRADENYDSSIYKGLLILFHSNKNIKVKTIVSSKCDNDINNYISIKGTTKGLIFYLSPLLLIIGYILYIGGKGIFSGVLPDVFLLSFLPIPLLCILIWAFIKIVPIIKRYKHNSKYFENLKLEDISFDKRFKVYSEDQIEGRYLVTPAFMDRLYNLQTAFGVDNIKCSFYDDKIMFAISTNKDLFELGNLYQPFGKSVEEFYDEIASIYEMIDYFKLNERTGL